jgi:hypothetical protein
MEGIDPQSQNPALKRLRPEDSANVNLQQSLVSAADNDPLSKKARLDEQVRSGPVPPSKVVHIRGLPFDVSDQEIVQLCLSFGRVVQMVVLRQKQQALVEMQDVTSASLLVQYYSSMRPAIRCDRRVGGEETRETNKTKQNLSHTCHLPPRTLFLLLHHHTEACPFISNSQTNR